MCCFCGKNNPKSSVLGVGLKNPVPFLIFLGNQTKHLQTLLNQVQRRDGKINRVPGTQAAFRTCVLLLGR